MKALNLIALIATAALVSLNAAALPVAFERSFRNYAWSVHNNGCFVDEQRYIYIYDEIKGEQPIQNIGRVSPGEFQRAQSLLAGMYRTKFNPGPIAFDAGILVWRGYALGNPIDIKLEGDRSGQRDSEQVPELVDLINTWCPKDLLPSMPHQ